MPGSEAYNIASGSPRATASSSCWVLIALRIPRRRWVGRTAIQLTAAAGSSLPPGIVSSKEKSRPVPTISSPSKAASVRSSSRLVQSSSRRAGSIRSPNAMRSVRVNAGSSSRVTGRRKNSDATSPCLLDLVTTRPRFLLCPWRPRRRRVHDVPSDAAARDRRGLHARPSPGSAPRDGDDVPDSERQQSDTEVLIDGRYRNRDQRTRNPRDLEPGLEPGEAAPSNGVGRVALEEAVEGDASGSGAGGHEQRAYTADHEHEAEHPCGLAVVAEAEGEEEREEPDRPSQQTHRAAGEDDARRVELFLLELRVRARLLLFDTGDLPREHRPDRVDERGEDQ